MKICIISDTHRGIRNSSKIFLEYQDKFYSKILFPYCQKNSIKTIIHLGDYFDNRKHINVEAINEDRRQFVDPCKRLEIEVIVLVGNHDVFYRNTNRVNSLKEILSQHSHFKIIEKPERIFNDILLIPWINEENYEECCNAMANTSASICAGHFELAGFEMYKGIESRSGFNPKPLEKFSMVLSGHFHTKSTKGNIHYLGSQMEFTQADCGDPKYFHVLDMTTKKLEAIRNPITIFETYVYDSDKQQTSDFERFREKFVKLVIVKNSDQRSFDKFVDNIQQASPHELRIYSHEEKETLQHDQQQQQTYVSDTKSVIYNYIESRNTNLDKKYLKKIMTDLFQEASIEE